MFPAARQVFPIARVETAIVKGVAQVAGELTVKRAPAIGWSEVGSREAALISRCAAGDEGACTELVAEHQRMVFHLALHMLGDHDEALDLSQEVFLNVFRTIGRFRGQSALRTWIYRIVINQARNRQRWWKRRHRAEQVSLEERLETEGNLPPANAAEAPDRLFGQKQLATRIRGALERLPFDQRTVVVLREIDGLSYDEIAFSLGVAVGTVKSRLTRARAALRIQLREADRT
jgi:RNA polymerase sigma-70 factor (ECF subfamily)